MKKFLAWYKGLPKEVQMAMVLLGLGTPTGLIFMVKRHFFPDDPQVGILEITFGFAIALIVISLLCWGVSALFSAKQKKRSNRMVADLSRDDQAGPASMDVKASIKANNEKFFNAVRDMKKNLGINVYDLPWYIVIGDSGCGKTRLINNGGLTFSTGKPEGYQLGTLNYNWWFTEDAVFIDMAGRLCNPQEDSDHREWQAFLDTISRGRRGFPINGAFVCISADHLLSDSPEKHEADANTALERLRELQGKLGVTFATYLIITKCDKILGFMQSFDRAERDITVKNQIFGWAKPGAFTELYDPEAFRDDFHALYARLNDLRLRRLHDDANDADLGLAYSFPEEFRELNDPLQTYVRTLFPMIRNPRAMKNLIFRGIFFTSATQEGAVILKHLAQRLGAEAAEQFPSLDKLYPEKRPLFVKDVFFRKAFPEQGLVFRNENDVVRSQKLATLVKIGSAVLSILLVSVLSWSYLRFKDLIGAPREHAAQAARNVSNKDESLKLGSALGTDIVTLNNNKMAQRVLAFPFPAQGPAEALRAIRAGAFEHSQMSPSLVDADRALTQLESWKARDTQCKDALLEYVKWWSCAGAALPKTLPDRTSMDRLIAAFDATVGQPPARDASAAEKAPRRSDDFAAQANDYFAELPKLSNWRNPFQLLPPDEAHRFATFKQALKLAHDSYWRPRATLSENHENPWVKNWITIDAHCDAARKAYDRLIAFKDETPNTRDEWDKLKSDFAVDVKKLDDALDAVKWNSTDPEKGKLLRDAVATVRNGWFDYRKQLLKQGETCARIDHPDYQKLVEALVTGTTDMDGLDKVLCQELKKKQLWAAKEDCDSDLLAKLPGEGLIREVSDAWQYIIDATGFVGAVIDPKVVLTEDARALRGQLDKMNADLGAAGGALCIENPDPLGCWNAAVEKLLSSAKSSTKDIPAIDLKFEKDWGKLHFIELQKKHAEWLQQGQGTLLLTEIAERLGKTGAPGLADLFADHRETVRSAYGLQAVVAQASTPAVPAPESPTRTRTRTTQDSQPTEPQPKPARDRNQEPDSAPPQAARSRISSPVPESALKGSISRWLRHDFFDTHLTAMSALSNSLKIVPPAQFHAAQRGGSKKDECLNQIDDSSKKFVTEYVSNWVRLYEARTLPDLKPATDTRDWTSLAAMLGGDSKVKIDVQDDVTAALGEILQAVPYALWYSDKDNPEWGEPSGDEFWDDIRAWRKSALAASAAGRWTFLSEARLGDEKLRKSKDLHPVRALAAEVGREWARLADAIVAAREIPRRFPDQNKKLSPIPWNGIQKLQDQWNLRDEKLTGELVEFEKRAKSMLDAELTSALIALQGAHAVCGTAACPSVGTDLTAFKNFLLEVANAQAVLSALEDGLSNMPQSPRRATFYKQCAAWKAFLDGPLKVDVWGDDPLQDRSKYPGLMKEDNTPAQLYNEMQLQLGLEKQGGGILGENEVSWTVVSVQWVVPKTGFWTWSSGNAPMKFLLSKGKQTTITVKGAQVPGPELPTADIEFGRTSPFSLVSLLLDSGTSEPNRDKWYILQRIDLRDEFKDNKTVLDTINAFPPENSRSMVMGFILKLDRPMPVRIGPL